MNDQISIYENQIIDPDLNFNSELTEEEQEFVRNNQDLVEEFEKNFRANPTSSKSFIDSLIEWIRGLLS